MEEKQIPDGGQERWRRMADTVLLLNRPKSLLVLLVWIVTWAISRPLLDQGGILPTLVFQFGATVIPLYFLLVLLYTVMTFVGDKRDDGQDNHRLKGA